MFHELMVRFQLELFTYFSTVIPLTSCVFFPVGLSSLTPTVNCPRQETEETTKICLKCRVNDERLTGKKTQLVSGTTVEK